MRCALCRKVFVARIGPPSPLPDHGLARTTDPETSKAAAASIDPRGQHALILGTLRTLGKANSADIAAASGLTEHQTGRRLPELERAGAIRWTGAVAPGPSGRAQRVFEVIPQENE